METRTKLKVAESIAAVALVWSVFATTYAIANVPVPQPFFWVMFLGYLVFLGAAVMVFHYFAEIENDNKRYW